MVSKEAVKAFLKERNEELKFFQKLQEICGNIRKSTTNLAFIKTWRDWNFSEEMITEAAKRSATSSNPLPYMNRILSDWKEAGVYAMKDIPSAETQSKATGFIPQNVQNLNAKTDRERYYALLREKAQVVADKFTAKANKDGDFKAVNTALSKSPRNCDVGTADEQAERFDRWCDRKNFKACWGIGCRECLIAWSQMPYEGGGAK